MEEQKIKDVEKIIGYTFKDKNKLNLALTHSSADGERNYERLEFLGDSILDFVVAEYLMKNFDLNEGKMTEKRKNLVNKKFLAKVVTENRLENFLETMANIENSDKMKSSIFESLAAAIYYDSGMDAAYAFIIRFLEKYFHDAETDYKSRLNEVAVKKLGEYPIYNTVEKTSGKGGAENSADGKREGGGRFFSAVIIKDVNYGGGSGESKRQAEQAAAKETLKALGDGGKIEKKWKNL
jgi:ribonuclease-3